MARSDDAVREWLDAASDAARRARRDPSDAGALHRFRINARRLIVYVKVLEKACGFPFGARKRLRRALRATGPWRDGHVGVHWLDDYAARSRGSGAAALAQAYRRRGAPVSAGPGWRREVDKALRRLRRGLDECALKKSELRAARRAAAAQEWRRLARRLRRLGRARDSAALHSARIAVKRLRYQLDTMEKVPCGLPKPSDLRRLQSALGEVHDREVIAAEISALGRGAQLRAPTRRALRRLKREESVFLARARRCWEPLLKVERPFRCLN